ncbi:hypothetical protein CO154_01265 [Candidatus Pacearchaeota archaeon CG_4_9_14_3_um_filter_31_7]|nr:MAG: hypothetical protein AUJ10_02995 [Candidatus Pacearchaeota archaeon CG1_02_31_27]PIN92059.1 MAG: hypothetical protein COU55_02635 [Candidatus Pacearchaeota archaeon CG10_big_fil_rev_8_21_14_0_10_31_59]PIZ81079.1 MAG: hypothetical protein COX99_00830 [Candidatus Pacearchaeota archaeon CG_4_10_14_0_2_um_filter_31_10]PJA70769.1 MAG: hypothetical protein CO154_01265 [Candidatus Pacearchaeota archaeon CG_4_9_14_3_um_filter_31_7]
MDQEQVARAKQKNSAELITRFGNLVKHPTAVNLEDRQIIYWILFERFQNRITSLSGAFPSIESYRSDLKPTPANNEYNYSVYESLVHYQEEGFFHREIDYGSTQQVSLETALFDPAEGVWMSLLRTGLGDSLRLTFENPFFVDGKERLQSWRNPTSITC